MIKDTGNLIQIIRYFNNKTDGRNMKYKPVAPAPENTSLRHEKGVV
jgi:hypothetical protein